MIVELKAETAQNGADLLNLSNYVNLINVIMDFCCKLRRREAKLTGKLYTNCIMSCHNGNNSTEIRFRIFKV